MHIASPRSRWLPSNLVRNSSSLSRFFAHMENRGERASAHEEEEEDSSSEVSHHPSLLLCTHTQLPSTTTLSSESPAASWGHLPLIELALATHSREWSRPIGGEGGGLVPCFTPPTKEKSCSQKVLALKFWFIHKMQSKVHLVGFRPKYEIVTPPRSSPNPSPSMSRP